MVSLAFMRALVVVNPAATSTTAAMRDVLVGALAGELKVEVVETAHRGHGRELGEQAAAQGVDLVVSVGGDGTVNEVVNGLLANGPAPHLPMLAVVPGGSTNVFSRALGRSRDPVEATGEILASVRAGRTRMVSLGTVAATGTSTAPVSGATPRTAAVAAAADAAAHDEWTAPRWFVFAAGLGFDAEVVRRVEQARFRGRVCTPQLYLRQIATQYFTATERRTPLMTLELSEEPSEIGLANVIVQNTAPWTYLGGRPVDACPAASFDTGLDVTGLRVLRVPSTIRVASQMLMRRPALKSKQVVSRHDSDGFVVRASRPMAFQVDGDYLGERGKVEFVAVPRALRVMC